MHNSLFETMIRRLDMDESMITSVIQLRHVCTEGVLGLTPGHGISDLIQEQKQQPSKQQGGQPQGAQQQDGQQQGGQPQGGQPQGVQQQGGQPQGGQQQGKQQQGSQQIENKTTSDTQQHIINAESVNQEALFQAYSNYITNKQNEITQALIKEYGEDLVNELLAKYKEMETAHNVDLTKLVAILQQNKDKPIDDNTATHIANKIVNYWTAIIPKGMTSSDIYDIDDSETNVETNDEPNDKSIDDAPQTPVKEQPKVDYGEQPDAPKVNDEKQPDAPKKIEEQPDAPKKIEEQPSGKNDQSTK